MRRVAELVERCAGLRDRLESKTVVHLDGFDRDIAAGLLRDALAAHGLVAAYHVGALTDAQRRLVLGAVCDRAADRLKEMAVAVLAAHPDSTKSLGEAFGRAMDGFFAEARRFLGGALLAGALAVLGPKDLAADDEAQLERGRVAQVGYLDGFQAAVRDGTQPIDGTLAARASLYGHAVHQVGQNLGRGKVVRAGAATREMRVTTSGDPCGTCTAEAARGWQPIGTLAQLGDSICMSQCRCFFIFE